jgi:exocyst complex component 6
MTPFLESHQTFFAQIAGFFIIEDRILRTGGGLVSRTDVDSLWDVAVAKMVSVLEDQFSRMQTANHLLLIKDYVGLLGMQHYCTVLLQLLLCSQKLSLVWPTVLLQGLL